MPGSNGSQWMAKVASCFVVLFYRMASLASKGASLVKGAFRVLYQLSLGPLLRLFHFFFWSPAAIITRNVVNLMFLPTNLPLILFYNTTLSDLTKINLRLTTVTIALSIQYFVTLMALGILIGAYCGLCLGTLHRWIRIPEKRVDVFGGLTRWLFPHTAYSSSAPLPKPHPWQSAQYPSPSTTSTTVRGEKLQRKGSRSSIVNVSNMVSKLPHDFFQPKSPHTPTRRSEKARFDTSKLSPVSTVRDDEIESNYSSAWDFSDELPETLRTELTGRASTFPRPYASGSERPSYSQLKPLKNNGIL
ncbi:Ldb16p [Lachancea thermotolerans CBS 6340]|uniref:KLTH0H12386p n=1 Tax=Lachancea thermotolerans (strain ATCC 56472 / CBS 6340 / NRRL Y-8284) TaxID=559295 RepID=C5E3D2_LACTC|nr:KLTH0H12386p [Lachancea thermotolerans CBS 6340]CAR30543.1 KLTH0H12386p [Lachancea thermotolerans CBS 6340]